MGIALIDGDVCCYKACYSAEYSVYSLADEGTFRYKKELAEFLNANYDEDEAEELHNCATQHKIVEPFEKAEYAARQIIDSALTALGTDQYEMYLGGKGNFRNEVPYPVKYKGNRPPKPVHYEKMRAWLIKNYNAVVVDGMETDDRLSQRQRQLDGKSVIVSIDKDLLQVPGYHYHLDKRTLTKVSEIEAFRNLGIQLLTGDSVDNVIGIKGVGPKTAEKMLDGLNSPDTIYAKVKEEYQKEWPDTWDEMFQSNMMLLMLKAA